MTDHLTKTAVFTTLKERGPTLPTYVVKNWLRLVDRGVKTQEVRKLLMELERDGWVERTGSTRPNEIEWRICRNAAYSEDAAVPGGKQS